MRYALRRKKKKNPENFENYKKEMLDKLINSVKFYTAFTENDFMQGMQFKYMRKITFKRTLKLQERLQANAIKHDFKSKSPTTLWSDILLLK